MNLCKATTLTALFLCAGCAYAQTATESACTESELVKAALEDREFRIQAEREIRDEIERKLKENHRKISVLGANVFCTFTALGFLLASVAPRCRLHQASPGHVAVASSVSLGCSQRQHGPSACSSATYA